MEWLRRLLLPIDQGSEFAKHIDVMYMAIFWLSVVMFLGLMIPMCYFAWRYRYKPGRVTPHQTHSTLMEVTWTVVPLLLCDHAAGCDALRCGAASVMAALSLSGLLGPGWLVARGVAGCTIPVFTEKPSNKRGLTQLSALTRRTILVHAAGLAAAAAFTRRCWPW